MDSLCPFLLASMLYQELALPFSFASILFFFKQDSTIHQCVEVRIDEGNYLFSKGCIKSSPKTSLLLFVSVNIIRCIAC